jgi:hypothetical protein
MLSLATWSMEAFCGGLEKGKIIFVFLSPILFYKKASFGHKKTWI